MSKSASQQEHLITPMGFALLVFFVIAMMILLYPSKEALFSGDKSSDDLKSLFKNPDKLKYEQTLNQTVLTPREVLTIVEELSEKGLWKEARHLLSDKLPKQLNGAERREAALWMLQSHLDEYYISQNKGEKIERPLGSARAQLQRFEQIDQLSLEELRLLAKSSLEFGLIPQAIQTYFRLAVIDQQHALDWLDQAGTRAMQIQYYSEAIKAYKWANTLSKTEAEKKTYLYAWLDAANKAGHGAEVKKLIDGIEADLPSDAMDLEKLANISLDIGRPSIAHRLYARLAEVDSSQAKYWYEKAGVWALSNQEYQQSADYFAGAEKLTSNPEEMERLQYKQYEVFTAAEMPQKALEKIQAIVEKHSDDQKLLQKGVNAALAAKAPQLARRWNTKYLQNHPNDLTALHLQSDIEIRDKHYDQAIVYVKRILKIDDKHLESHKKLAFLLETQGKDVKALQQWQRISQLDQKTATQQAEYQKHILRLAQATLNEGGLTLLLSFSQKQKLPEQTVQDIASYYMAQKQADKAQQFLSRYVQYYPASLALWERLVSLQQKQPELALATWETIEQQFGANHKTRLARIEILWSLER
jgi:tetratricopeptide (TPR) repeat protein